MNLGLGAALDLPVTGLRLALDANFPRAYYQDVRVGAEWRWHDLVALRAGYRRELDAPADLAEGGPSFGIGAGAHGLWLDYGYLVPGVGEGQHRLSVTLRPGRFGWLAGDPFGQKNMPRRIRRPEAGGHARDPARGRGAAEVADPSPGGRSTRARTRVRARGAWRAALPHRPPVPRAGSCAAPARVQHHRVVLDALLTGLRSSASP